MSDSVSCYVPKTESGGYCLQSDDARYTPGPNGVKPLSPEQEELIHRLVYFQNEYEQPSEEDLKRIEVGYTTSVVLYSRHPLDGLPDLPADYHYMLLES